MHLDNLREASFVLWILCRPWKIVLRIVCNSGGLEDGKDKNPFLCE